MPTLNKVYTANEVIALGNASNELIGTFVVQFSSLTGTLSVVPKGRIHGSGIAAAEYALLAYTVGSSGVFTATATPITAEGVYFIRADGMDIFLDATIQTSVTITAIPVHG